MNKQDLISAIASQANLERTDAVRAVETMLEVITSALKRRDKVRLVGFGAFSVTQRKASIGIHPRSGEPLEIPSIANPRFRAGKALRDAVQ